MSKRGAGARNTKGAGARNTKGPGAQKQEESQGSGLLSTLLLAGGAAAVGFLANDLWTSYKEYQQKEQGHQSTSSDTRERTQRDSWGDVNQGHKRKENRSTTVDPNVPDEVKCIVCMENPREVILVPCGHVCLCEDCAEKVTTFCPVCRIPIKATKNAYLA